MRCSRTEAPSLHRRYPASPVLRASPPPCSARPDPRGLSVGACHATGRASRVASIPLVHTCRRHYPGGTGRCSRRSLPDRWQPSPYSGRVGFRITRFEACAAFTSLRPAWSLNRPGRPLSSECFSRCRYLHRPLRLLPAGATVAGRDSHPLRNGAFHGAPERPVKGSGDTALWLATSIVPMHETENPPDVSLSWPRIQDLLINRLPSADPNPAVIEAVQKVTATSTGFSLQPIAPFCLAVGGDQTNGE